jgi:chlorite dismutase
MRPTQTPAEQVDPLHPAGGGWHCSHLYYSFDRRVLASLSSEAIAEGTAEFCQLLADDAPGQPVRMQSFVVSGHKADFGLMLMDPDPLVVDSVHQRLLASKLGPALVPGYSFVSITEISEYVYTVEEFGERLVAEGLAAGTPEYETRLKGYADRLGPMNKQRLTPEFPPYRAMCFYPMNKMRGERENWFRLPKSERNRLMSEHARSGIAFAGKVSQLITVAVGLDDWEWGVTLWASNPGYLKDIVYKMRFDEASARYAEFGPFLVGYVMSPKSILNHCKIGAFE